jgi:heme A synthase
MLRIKWDRLLAAVIILLSPLIYAWLHRRMAIGSFGSLPVLGVACQNPEVKALMLLAILLLAAVCITRVLLKD